jgi:hypothetical protein
MNKYSKDSVEVVEFMTLFTRLKDWCDDAPDELADLAKTDSSVEDLCSQLFHAANLLRDSEQRGPVLFTGPVDPAFIGAWRDYEQRYETVVSDIEFSNIFIEFSDIFPPVIGDGKPSTPKLDLAWDHADEEAEQQADGITEAINFAQSNAEQDHRWVDSEDFIERVQSGIAALHRLKRDFGFDFRGVFRRRSLIPFVLVPRQVAAKHGNVETLSMLKNLQHAHNAFVYGATYAALGLMRSIMESVLRDHYRAEGSDLGERIRNARSLLPRGANEAALHRLRKLANAILHLDRSKDEGLPIMNEVRLEKEIVSLLLVLRALIEGAK